MKILASALTMMSVLAATDASAQAVNLSGRYICIQGCATAEPGQFAYVTQYGRDLNLVNEIGQPSRAWIDWPGRIWADGYQQGAIVSPDGMVIQFDHGTVWQRDLGLPDETVARPSTKRRKLR